MVYGDSNSPVRIVTIDGKPWFVAKDVTDLLGYKNSKASLFRHCEMPETRGTDGVSLRYPTDSDGVSLRYPTGNKWPVQALINDALGREQKANLIDEANLYRLIMSSKMPNADKFKEWVVSVVLPGVMKKAKEPKMEQLQLDFSERALPRSYPEALRLLADQVEKNEKLLMQNTEMEPKAEFYDSVVKSEDLLYFREVAKILDHHGMGGIGLIKELEKMGVLFRREGRPIAKQVHIAEGRFKLKESEYVDGLGKTRICITTMVTQKGVDYINKKLKERNI